MNIKPTIILGLILTILTGCIQQEDVERGDVAELTFKLLAMSADGGRGNVTDYPNTPSQWTQAEKAVDGRYMYTVSVYIIDKNKRIAASQENIQVADMADELLVTFDKSYNLKRGVYTVMAVANNANHTIGNTTYASGLSKTWNAADYNALMNNMIAGNATHNISAKDVVQPLSMMKDVELHAGTNSIEGELKRTFARIRIEVKNNSGMLPLKVKNVSFSDNFTQSQAYVFDDGTDRKYLTTKKAPVSTSDKAILPFAKDAGSDGKVIETQKSAVVFDSYLLESQVGTGEYYKYTLDLAYEGAMIVTYSYKPVWTAITSTNNMNVGDESYFLLYNNNRKRYLSGGTSSVTTATLNQSSVTVATDHVWQLVSAGSGKYYVKNVETGLYMQNPGSSSVALGSSPVAFSFTSKTSGRNTYIIIQGSNNSYVYVGNSNTGYAVKGSSSNSDSGVYFTLYKVNKEKIISTSNQGGTITYNTPIVLTTLNPVTQQSSPTKAIKRNDFINVLVTVSYNPEAGTFEFYVEDWQTGGGSVDFE